MLYFKKRLKLYVWKFKLDNEQYNIKLKENEGHQNNFFIINNQKYEIPKKTNKIINYKQHQFNFVKLKDKNFQLYIDLYSFDDLKQNKNFCDNLPNENREFDEKNQNNISIFHLHFQDSIEHCILSSLSIECPSYFWNLLRYIQICILCIFF